jgi:UDP-N-acetylmuramoylalanine--D-glutamate ligase
MGGHTDRCFSHSDWVITSPGIPPSATIMKELLLSGKTIISEVELAWREAPQIPIVAITGTNGKTTTTTLASAIFTHAGKKAPAGGNIGIPLISLLDNAPDYLIAELSSYQLAFSPQLNPKVAIYTNFRPDHLDWHGSIAAYQQAKASLFLPPKSPQWSVLNAADPVCRELSQELTTPIFWFSLSRERVESHTNWISLDSSGMIWVKRQSHETGQPEALFNINESPLLGAHNQENILAAIAAALACDIPLESIRYAVSQFHGVEHRMELLPEVDGIRFYNDSKATNPDATICALNAFGDNPVVLIAGGRDKKTDLTEWIESVKTNTHCTVLLGEAAERFENELKAHGYTQIIRATSFEDAVA